MSVLVRFFTLQVVDLMLWILFSVLAFVSERCGLSSLPVREEGWITEKDVLDANSEAMQIWLF